MKERRTAAAIRPLSNLSAARSVFACSQSIPATELSIVTGISGDRRRVRPLVRQGRSGALACVNAHVRWVENDDLRIRVPSIVEDESG